MNFHFRHVAGFFRRFRGGKVLVPAWLFILLIFPVNVFSFTSATLQGIVTNGATGQPVVGARIIVNGKSTLSTSGGVYTLSVSPVGTYPVVVSKTGFDNFTSQPVVFTPGTVAQLNCSLWETLNAPSGVMAAIDTSIQQVTVSWTSPAGPYELLYDDGLQNNFTVWSAAGNMNALKFTPVGFPAKITGGSIHIGMGSNYPSGVNLTLPFQVIVYDAAGTGGTPGNALAGPFEVVPAAFGWVEFTLPSPVTINAGSFFIAMVQGGSPPSASGIAIDETNPQFRSYSRFVSGGSAWFPAGGNFMIRAKCTGSGGPVFLDSQSLAAGNNNIYRLRQGEEQNPSAWTLVGSTPGNSITDPAWVQLPCGPYRWGVKAQYPGNRWSTVAFSNVIGKCWTAPINILVNLSCSATEPGRSLVRMVNLAYPDTVYEAVPDTEGHIAFTHVWKGNYSLEASCFGYDTLFQSVPVAAPVSLNLQLLQVKSPPANLIVNDSSLMARWDVPHYEQLIFSESWNSNNFTANNWTLEGGNKWTISQVAGNPAPSATFSSSTQLSNYSQSLVSKSLVGLNSTLMKLKYDVSLDVAGTTTVNNMAVELWDGSGWLAIKNYSSAEGDLAWTRDDLDISAFANQEFRIRFRAYGENSADLLNWNIDNIEVTGSEPAQEQANCILGYYFYLGNVISGYTTKNAYPIPGNQVLFGQSYHACVRALYGSGYSDSTCTDFTSAFLFPVLNLEGSAVENTAFVTWEKPQAPTDSLPVVPPGLQGYTITRDDSVIAHINDPDSLFFYDQGLEPGYYLYGVAASYDLGPYGYPGQIGESLSAGPLHITINWGRQLPFYESWNSGTFAFNEWRFTPSQGNWFIDANEGIPSPAANFKWYPPAVNYDQALESPPFNGLPYNCAAIWLDFDLKLNDRNFTGTEKMIVEVYYNNIWQKKAEISNVANLPWTNHHIDISPVRGKGFRVRFRASGQNSSELLNWYIDNVNIYPICYPAANPEGEAIGNDIRLTWSPPACYGGNLLNEGFESDLFPPDNWSLRITNPTSSWTHTDATSPQGVHNGNFSAGLNWDYNHQDEWLIAEDIYVNGDLTFWSYAFQGSLHLDHYYVKVSVDQGITWDVLMDMSALPPYPGLTGVNAWETPYHVDLSPYDGETVDIGWHAVDGDGNGLWYPWAIDDCSIGGDDFPRQISGYDIYRKSSSEAVYAKINAEALTDTTWLDTGLFMGQYRYYIQALFSECENALPSDTVLVDVITGIEPAIQAGRAAVYPNPASDHMTISSSFEIVEVRLYEMSGILTAAWFPSAINKLTVDIQGFAPGLYLVIVQDKMGLHNFKVCFIK